MEAGANTQPISSRSRTIGWSRGASPGNDQLDKAESVTPEKEEVSVELSESGSTTRRLSIQRHPESVAMTK